MRTRVSKSKTVVKEKRGRESLLGVLVDDAASLIVHLLESSRSLLTRDVSRVVDRTINEFLEFGPDLLESFVVLEVLVESRGRLECGSDIASEGFDDLTKESDSVLGFLVGFSIELDVGGSSLSSINDLLLGEFEVLSCESGKGVDSFRVFGLILDLVDDLFVTAAE